MALTGKLQLLSGHDKLWPQIIIVSASIADTLSAIRMASIFYSTDGGATWGNITMTTSTTTSTTYEGEIQSPAP